MTVLPVMPDARHTLAYRPEIDGLRAVAVLAVVLFHADLGFTGGFVGVDVFLVISGFLITSLLRRDLAAGRFSLAGFYERRARRILPASLAMTATVLAAGWLKLLPSDLEALGASAVYHTLFSANFYFYGQATNYFGTAAGNMPLLHTWSLGVEEQFYFAFPLVLLLCHAIGRRRSYWVTVAAVACLLGLGLAWAVYSVPRSPTAGFFLLPARAWELLAGAGLAMLPACGASRAVREATAFAGMAAILYSATAYTERTIFPGLAAVPPCVGAALVLWSCQGRGTDEANGPPFRQALVGRLLASRPFVFVGAISYSLYLWHWPALVFAGYWQLGPPGVGNRLAALGVAVVLAVVSWALIERPVRQRRWLAGRRSLFVAVAVAMIVTAGVGWLFAGAAGLPRRFDARVLAIDAVRRERSYLPQHKALDVMRGRLTPLGVKTDGPVDVLLWGDSHAAAVMPAVDAVLAAHGLRGRAAIHSSMAPLIDYAVDSTKFAQAPTVRYNAEVLKYVQREHVKTVLLVNYWKRDLLADPGKLAEAMGRTIDALRAAGATTYVMLQVPGYAVPVPKALAGEAVFGHAINGWRRTPDDFRREQQTMYDLAAKYEAADCHFIDASRAFANGDGAAYTVASPQGRPLYLDNHHLTAAAATELIAPLLDRELFRAATARGSP